MDEERMCLNCKFLDPDPHNSVVEGWCKIILPPFIQVTRQNGIRNAQHTVCDLHRHLNQRIE